MNKAKLELPVKDFHNLYDLLGHALDHDAEAGYLDFDPEDISLLESVREEMFSQIPEEETFTEYAIAGRSTNRRIKAKKLYKILRHCPDGGFRLEIEDGDDIFCIPQNCAFLDGGDWKFVTLKD